MKAKPRITTINIGRVYNLGNYENLRFELSVEIPNGYSVKNTLRNAMNILRAASPKAPVSESDCQRAETQIKDPEAWHKNMANKKERRKLLREMVKSAKETLAKRKAWEARRTEALRLLDDMSCTITRKDAKFDWHNDDDYWNE